MMQRCVCYVQKSSYLAAPFLIPAHLFKNHVTGGVFTLNVKVLFEKAVDPKSLHIEQLLHNHYID